MDVKVIEILSKELSSVFERFIDKFIIGKIKQKQFFSLKRNISHLSYENYSFKQHSTGEYLNSN